MTAPIESTGERNPPQVESNSDVAEPSISAMFRLSANHHLLSLNGWCKISAALNTTLPIEQQLAELCQPLGVPCSSRRSSTFRYDKINVVKKNEANNNSQSSRYGTGSFPYHTDAAHWPTPGKFVLMACTQASSDRPTYLLPVDFIINEIGIERLSGSVFRVINGRRSFYASVYRAASQIFRFDPSCMVPADAASQTVQDEIISLTKKAAPVSIHWKTGDVVVFNNWQMLHARGDTKQPRECRAIIRTHILPRDVPP